MANKYLAREDAPFGSDVWDMLDTTMKAAASAQMVGRRLLEIEGPYGLGLKAVPLQDFEDDDTGLVISDLLPVHMIYYSFALSARELATYEDTAIPFDTRPVAEAAIACARAEDELIFHGASGVDGLLTVDGAKEVTLSAWDEVGVAAGDVITAMTTLDEAGFHGPYTLALAPERYNLLYRLYPRGNKTEMDHVRAIATDGVHKAPVLDSGGVLIATGRQYLSIVLGQDMAVGFIGPVGYELELSVSESLALRIRRPEAICVLRS
jgi:uncharacterized linocin/CFP29 family protein